MNDTQIILAFYEYLKGIKKAHRSELHIKDFAMGYVTRYQLLIGYRDPTDFNRVVEVCKFSMAELNHIAEHDVLMRNSRLIVT